MAQSREFGRFKMKRSRFLVEIHQKFLLLGTVRSACWPLKLGFLSQKLWGFIGLMVYARTEDIPQAQANSPTPVLIVVGQSYLVFHQDAVQIPQARRAL